jgi:hypothetical protein
MRLHTLLAFASIGCSSSIVNAATDPSSADHAAAARLLYPNLQDTVRNESVSPHWIGDQGTFWYQRDGNDGREFVVVTSKGVKAPAFDHKAVARAIYRAMGQEEAGKGLPASLSDLTLSGDLNTLTGELGAKRVECDLKAASCRLSSAPLHHLKC